jgi:hypothetical protein
MPKAIIAPHLASRSQGIRPRQMHWQGETAESRIDLGSRQHSTGDFPSYYSSDIKRQLQMT